MPLNADEFLTAAEKFPDTTEIKVGEDTLTLGDLRGRFGAVARERDEFSRTASTLEQTLAAMRTARNATQTDDEPQEPRGRRLTPEGVKPADESNIYEGVIDLKDPYSQRLMAEVSKLTKRERDALEKQFNQQNQQQFGAAARLIARLTAQAEYKEHEWPKDYNPRRAYEEAAQRGLINKETGLPDLAALNERVTEPMRLEKTKKAAYEEGFAAAEKKLREEMADRDRSRFKVVKGGSALTGEGTPIKPGSKPKTLRQVFDNLEISPEDVAQHAMSAAGLMRS